MIKMFGKETETLEFKKSTGELKKAVISIASILNKSGKGEVYFGIRNDGTVLGRRLELLLYTVYNACVLGQLAIVRLAA